ncbi:DUF3606 domain-containing protein [Aquabacterium sp. A7-Y]|uniref:DUF3606 domain-containing protein n=1 Tax=Aquabacterium sp. A7-Y TaxID=1349605 RepID=UPI00223E2BD2|nr:DUF3606 domain-containing protein [Aquabacterium sp. A7-Y]MCW7539407.1 DUF3606 domain-containing protein [Aquabacterium sp. A7-Y]
MATEIYDRAGHERIAVDIDEESELEYWVTELGVSAEDLRRAVETVGHQAASVRTWLATHTSV